MSIKPTLDVSDVLLSPEFADTIVVLRRTESVNKFGEPIITTKKYPDVIAVVTTPGPNELVRTPDAQYGTDSITVITQFRLFPVSKSKGKNYSPDLIQYGGTTYIVDHLDDYSRYGAGFVEASCSATDYIDASPE